jgi:hypothetical protein
MAQTEQPTAMPHGPLRKVFENNGAVVFMVLDAT